MSDEIRVTEDPQRHRYEITVDGTRAGFSAYHDTDASGSAQRILYHTEISEEFGGQGLASTLTREAVASTVDAGLRVVPLCPYVKKWVESHDEFADSVDRVTSTHLALLS